MDARRSLTVLRRWLWLMVPVGVALPVSQSLAVMATANHYLLDIVAGVAVSLLALPLAMALQRWAYPALDSALQKLPLSAPGREKPPPRAPGQKGPGHPWT